MRRGVDRLSRVIAELEAFDVSTINKRWGPEQQGLESAIEGALGSVFGHGTVEYLRYSQATSLDHGSVSVQFVGHGYSDHGADIREARENVAEGRTLAITLLRQAMRWLEDEIGDANYQVPVAEIPPKAAKRLGSKVFIVHGHDDGPREAVARFVEKIGFDAVILKEQANEGRTIIEKIDANKDVSFAIVLLSPDDVGSKFGEELRPRARQNVLLELGYFIGSLGRAKVCALATSGNMELPTDFAGVVWEPFDSAGGWKQSLAREMVAAGFPIDWNVVMGQ